MERDSVLHKFIFNQWLEVGWKAGWIRQEKPLLIIGYDSHTGWYISASWAGLISYKLLEIFWKPFTQPTHISALFCTLIAEKLRLLLHKPLFIQRKYH